MSTAYTHRDSNIRKTWFLMLGFFLVVIGIGWAFSWVYGNPWILYIAVAISLLMNIFSYWYSDKIVLKATGARPVTRESHRELWNITENLCISIGLPMPKLYVIPDRSPNAFATGRDPDHAAVAVTEGLMELLERNELEGVIAHELSHIQNRDILVMTIVVVLVGFVTLISDLFLRSLIFGGVGGNRDARFQLIMIAVGVALAIISPIVAIIIKLAVSRKREFLADASGALMTRYPEGLANALQKISGSGKSMRKANHAMAHMFIANPFGSKAKTGFMNKLFMTHPPVEERVRALLNKEG